MPTGNGGITQGLALRLTNMEQGRREVTANQFRREQMDAMNEQRKAAADYRKALAEQKEAARQEKQISELQKTINVKGLHPIYQDVANRESAEFISRTIEGMKKVPNYTTSGEYLQDKDKVMGHQNLRLASSNNIFAGEKKVTQNADDYELQSDMYDAMKDLNYEGFIKANGGSDYVMADGNIQPKFNRAKVEAAMIKGSTEGEPIIDVPSEVGGFSVIKQKQPPNPEKLQALRDSYMDIIANSGMNNKDFIKQAEQIDEVYQSIKKSENFIGEKTLKRSRSVAEELALSQGKLNQKAAYNATKAANANKFKATKRAGGTTYTSPDVIIDDDVAGNGNIVIYKTIKNTTAVPMIPMPEGAMVENDKGMWDKKDKVTEGSVIVNPQYHFLKNGQVVLYGEIETLDTQLNKKVRSGLKRILMPNDPDLAPLAVSGINGQTKNALNVSFDTATGKYSYDIDEERTEAQPKGGGNSTSGNKTAPTNTKPAGGGQKKAAPKAANKGNSGGQRMKWNSTTHKMEAY